MNHLMLDLETMGTRPGCPVVSIGAVVFDFETFKIQDRFYEVIGLSEETERYELKFEADTVYWWLKQSEEARREITERSQPITLVLEHFTKLIQQHKVATVWGNAASFDCSILAELYRKVRMSVRWDTFRGERCYKTLYRLVMQDLPESEKILFARRKIDGMQTARGEEGRHNALKDAEFQVEVLRQLLLVVF